MKSFAEYGLNQNPFSSQGTETGRYPFVPSKAFNELIARIEKIRVQKDSSAIIVQGPQGSGKSATRNGIKDTFAKKPNTVVIQTSLSSLDIRDLAWSIIDNAKDQGFVDDAFLTKIEYEEGKDIEKPKLERITVKVLEEVVSKNELCILQLLQM